jgi:hypothetical protein
MTTSQIIAGQHAVARATPSLSWALRRAALGIAIMTVAVTAAACLLYFTIDPEAEARAEGDASKKPVVSQLRQAR